MLLNRVARYRPYAVALAGVLLITVVPSNNGSDDGGGAAVSSTPAASASDGAAGDAGAADASAVAALVTRSPSVASAIGGAARPAPGVSGPTASVGGVSYPGVGTPAALANPNCDGPRGKIKFPSIWAPACVVPWPRGADNGGATAPGVTPETIRVLWWLSSTTSSDADTKAKAQVIASLKLWENHLELWGRKLDVRFVKSTGTDETAQRADAVQAYNTHKPFISLVPSGNVVHVYSAELAARGVMTFDPDAFWKDTQAQAGYRWAVSMDDGMHARLIAEWVGKRIHGLPAKWAGDATMTVKARVFGLVHPDGWSKDIFDQEAAKYGVKLADVVTYQQGGDTTQAQEQARVQIARLKDKGVTSVIAVTDYVTSILLSREATLQQYSPEWVITGWGLQDLILFSRLYDQQQWSHAFGLGMINLLPPPEHWEQNQYYQWEYGKAPDDVAVAGQANQYARDMMPALQLAGPHLTPATFREAMFSKAPAGGPWAGSTTTGTSYGRRWLGLPWDDYSGWDGLNEAWWDPTQPAKEEALYTDGPGAYWRLNRGKQYFVGNIPTGESKMFDKSVAAYTVSEKAPEDTPPQYPREPRG